MKRLLFIILSLFLFAQPAYALEFTAPTVPESADAFMPDGDTSFGEDLLYVLKAAIEKIKPEIRDAAGVCLKIVAIVLLVSIINNLSSNTKKISALVGTLSISVIMLKSVNTMVDLGVTTITELSDYGKLILPVMTAALAAQGGVNASTALYAGTAFFTAVLNTVISNILILMLYLYICCCIAGSAIGETTVKRISDFIKWLMTWSLKIILYIFTGYMTVTGVVSGSVDASAVKATKLTISGVVPVIGNILSDASETILVGAGVMKNSVGIYGLVAFIAILIGPFLKITVQYILLKITAAVSEVFAVKNMSDLINSFSSCMGFLLAMTGTVCLLLMISLVCFLKGVT